MLITIKDENKQYRELSSKGKEMMGQPNTVWSFFILFGLAFLMVKGSFSLFIISPKYLILNL